MSMYGMTWPFSFNFEVRQIMLRISNSLQKERHFCFDANPYPTGRRGLRRNGNVWRVASSELSHFKLESTDRNIGQTGAAIEHIAPKADDAVGDRDIGQAGTVAECNVPDVGDIVWNYDTGQADAGKERPVLDTSDAVGDRDASQVKAFLKRSVPNASDAVGNRNVCQGAE